MRHYIEFVHERNYHLARFGNNHTVGKDDKGRNNYAGNKANKQRFSCAERAVELVADDKNAKAHYRYIHGTYDGAKQHKAHYREYVGKTYPHY